MSTSKLLPSTFCIALLIATGCGGGGGGSDNNSSQNSLTGVPRPIINDGSNSPPGTAPSDSTPSDSSQTPTSPNTPADNPGTPENPNTQNPNTPETPGAPNTPQAPNTPPQAPTAPQAPETPQPPPSGPATADLGNLIGNVRFEFSFSDSSDVFTLNKVFTEASRTTDPNTGLPLLQTIDGPTAISQCALTMVTPAYLCIEIMGTSLANAELRVFLFDLDTAGNGSGAFEFCPAGTDAFTCGAEVASSPDGTVSVSVNAPNAAPLGINQQRITVDISAHQLVAKQAQATSGNATTAPSATALLAAELVGHALARLPQ